MRSDYLGELGESHFKVWCAAAQISCNPSLVDKHGWDYLIEVPRTENSHQVSVDLEPAVYEGKVQIKATQSSKGFVQISLQNLRTLLMSPLATFIVVIKYEGTKPQNLFIVEFGESLAREVLLRLWKADVNGDSDRLNKLTMRVKYGDSHKLVSPSESHLKDWFDAYFLEYGRNISSKKARWIENLGFEDGRTELEVFFGKETRIDAAQNFFLGLSNEYIVEELRLYKRRFGIRSNPQKSLVSKELSSLKLTHQKISATAVVKTHEYSKKNQFNGHMVYSPLNDSIPESSIRNRFKSDGLNILFGPEFLEIRFDFLYDLEQKIPFKQVMNLVRFAKMMYRTQTNLILELSAENNGRIIYDFQTEYSESDELDWLYVVCEALDSLKYDLGYDTENLSLNISDCYRSRFQINTLHSQVEITKGPFDNTIEYPGFPRFLVPVDSVQSDGKFEIAILTQSKVMLGDLSIVVYFSILCDVSLVKDQLYNLQVQEVNLGPYASTDINSNPDSGVLGKLVEEFKDSFRIKSIPTFIFADDDKGSRVLRGSDTEFGLIF